MPFDQLLLPLLGGYFFVSRFHGTAYKISGHSGYKLILASSFVGVFLIIIATILIEFITRATDPALLHNVITVPAVVGLILLTFGSWKTFVAYWPNASTKLGTDSSIQSTFAKYKKPDVLGTTLALIVSVSGLLIVTVHVYDRHSATNIPISAALTVFSLLLMGWIISAVKSYSRLHGYQVSFRLGGILTVTCVLLLLAVLFHPDIQQNWQSLVPFEYAGTAFTALALGVVAVVPFNLLFPYNAAIDRLYENSVLDGIESIFYYSQVTLRQLMITLRNGKIYIGYVDQEIPIAGRSDDYVRIVPTASGYREDETHKVVITTFYIEHFAQAIADSHNLSFTDIAKIVPISEINAAGIFDLELYKKFQGSSSD